MTIYQVFAELNLTAYIEKNYRCCNCQSPIFVLIIGEPHLNTGTAQFSGQYVWRCTKGYGDCGCSEKWQRDIAPEKGEPKRDDR